MALARGVGRLLALSVLLLVVHASADGADGEYNPLSEDYKLYMQRVAAKSQREGEALQDKDVTAGDASKGEDQFATPELYDEYMQQVLANAPVAKRPLHPKGDKSIVKLGKGNLGEAAKDGASPAREVAFGKKTAQSSVMYKGVSSKAVDGRTDNFLSQGSCTHTAFNKNPWWRVNLGKTMNVQTVQIWNRGDCCGSRLSNFEVRVGDNSMWTKNPKCGNRWTVPQGQSMKVPCIGLQGKYVQVVIRSTQYLTLCEVKVMATENAGANAARGKPAAQSSTMQGGSADRAVDGRTVTQYSGNSCTHTEYSYNPWWRVDLGKEMTVRAVQIWNRGDCCGSRLSNFEVRVGNNAGMWSACNKCGGRWSIPQGQHKEISCGGQRGRFVFVVIRARQILSLCEVRVLTVFPKKGTNLALHKPTKQSSIGYGGASSRAVDGNIDTTLSHGSCTHTHYDMEPWWRVDLQAQKAVGAVQIWNRGDCCGARLSNFEVRVGNEAKWKGNKVCGGQRYKVAQGMRKTILCSGMLGRYVFVVIRNRGYLSMCEVRVLPWAGTKKSGCASQALGMESHKIKNGDISASSWYGDKLSHGPDRSRLNYRGSCWTAKQNKPGEYLQIRLKKRVTLTAVATQGRFNSNQWVTYYKLRYFDGRRWVWYQKGKPQPGNIDRNTVQRNKLSQGVKAQMVRFYPVNWSGSISMRVELFGRSCTKKPSKTSSVQQMSNGQKMPRCERTDEMMKCVKKKPQDIPLPAAPGFGSGVARLWYAQIKGADNHRVAGKSVYLSKGVDFRTEAGSVYASKNLVASKFVKINAWPGFGHGSANFWFAKRARKSFRPNTVYLQNADFRTQKGSIYSAENVQANRFLEVNAYPGYGQGSTKMWYSHSGKGGYQSETLYLKHGDFRTQKGSIFAARNLKAGRYLSISAFPKYGHGEAKIMYVQSGKAPFKSNTVYLRSGDFATQYGSIYSAKDVLASRYFRLRALSGYGLGEATLWFAKSQKNGFGPNTLYLKDSDFRTEVGSISAKKNLIAGRYLEVNAWPGFGSGSGKLWFSSAGKAGFKPTSLYLKDGDFRTQIGSIHAAADLGAGRFVKIAAWPGHGTGDAKLWYSHTAKGHFAANTLFLKEGDFRTQDGSIFAGNSLRASKYLNIGAFPGYGSGELQLWHCNKDKEGYKANSLYLKNGDFRTQAGSVYASEHLYASKYLKIRAFPGYGSGMAKLWYSQTGRGDYKSKSLYLSEGDFRTEQGSIHAAKGLHAGKYLKIAAWPGHGHGYAKFWHSATGHSGYGSNTLYLKSGHFSVQKGSLIASTDLQAGRYVKIGAMSGFGSGSTQLWYSSTGKGKFFSHTLYLDSGDFRTQLGSIASAKDVIAEDTLRGSKLDVKFAKVSGTIMANHLYLGGKTEMSEMETTTLLDVGSSNTQNKATEVGSMLKELSTSNAQMSQRNEDLRKDIRAVMGRITQLEELARR